jgi:predicted MFS family arabinose efflux permease
MLVASEIRLAVPGRQVRRLHPDRRNNSRVVRDHHLLDPDPAPQTMRYRPFNPMRTNETDADGQTGNPASKYPYYVLFVLGLVNLFNFVDRHILSVLIIPIQQEFGVSDEWMGILTGLAFVIVHSLFGIPLARLADRTTRRTVIAVGVAVWSAMTALTGLAQAFWQLLILRMGVGIGEAAGAPASHSLISDYFEPSRRATALSVYSIGVYAGIMFGYFAAGWIGENFGWRWTFVAVGLPGLGLAALVRWSVREPPRSGPVTAESWVDVLLYLGSKPAFVMLMIAASLHALAAYSAVIWTPTFLGRVHGMSLSQVGLWLGGVSGIGGAIGTLAGGTLADRLGRRDARWYGWIAAIAAFGSVPAAALYLLAESGAATLWAYLVFIILVGAYNGPLHAMNQFLAKPRMRAMAVAIHLLVVNSIGGALGPWLVGRLSDTLRPDYGEDGIRYSMLAAIGVSAFLAGVFYLIASVTLRKGIAEADEV